ncbi:DUF4387 domain-containing protein [Candidatus Formimonas warabiya]|uniref:Acyl-CoA synthetase n=1 Tax=Formimonas warabiya TaxID=1761012 RepID=A0A3G1KVV5_FORW1|nr:DUF4387 domain-containing protein [Candidatus Formimonas warabiya]ATW26582.1 acyl-CoA synthetase [Candidatus Formimonas warabiya]
MVQMKPLKEIAAVIRSKNAGPFEITLDIIFRNAQDFQKVKETGIINKEIISRIYNLPVEKIITFVEFEAANAIKVTIPRTRAQGSIGETDMHATQQHVPLMDIMIPWDV